MTFDRQRVKVEKTKRVKEKERIEAARLQKDVEKSPKKGKAAVCRSPYALAY